MRLGVIARGEDRGLGNQTYEACRHLEPDRVLLIDPGPDGRFTQHPERYTPWDTTTLRWGPGFTLDETAARRWLNGLDVVYTAETPYDDRLPRWAKDAGCVVVIHANPEQLSPERAAQLADAAWWAPTPWRLAQLPAGTRVVPMPVAERHTEHEPVEHVRFLHVAGWPTVGDRNGTELVAEAAQHLTASSDLIIRGQHKQLRRYRHPRLTVESGNVPNYWDLYRNADVLVIPRRFGGLCLPVQEAMQAGLAVVMSDCAPNDTWPGPRVPAPATSHVHTAAGNLPLHSVDPRTLAELLDELAADPDRVTQLRTEATAWATRNTWAALRERWLAELEHAAAR